MTKTFKAVYSPNKKGVYAISLVENPAMEGDFIALSKDEPIQLKSINEEKRLLLGLVLEPNKPIYRNDDRGEYHITFSEDVIENLSHDFFVKNNQHNSTIEHDGKGIEDVAFVQSWIVEDPEKDKTALYGLKYPKGSWVAMMKVNNDEVWNDYVKTGKVKGFSIDGMIEFEEVKLNMNMDKSILEDLKDGVNTILSVLKPKEEEVKEVVKTELGSVNSKEGVVIMYEGEELKEGVSVYVESEDKTERLPLPIGKYELEDGQVLIVKEEGIAKGMESAEQEAQPEAEQELEQEQGVGEQVSDAMNQIKSLVVKYSEQVNDLKAELSEIKTKLSKVAEEPVKKPVKTELTMTPYEKYKAGL